MVLFSMVLSRLIACLLYPLLANSFYKTAKKMKTYTHHLFLSPINQTPLVKSHPPLLHQHPPPLSPRNSFNKIPNLTKSVIQNLIHTKPPLLCDINGPILRSSLQPSSSTSSKITLFFPYFMLVAFEAGSILRSFLLLITYPLIVILPNEQHKLNVMVFVTFFGMRCKSVESIARTVLPKFFLEDLNPMVYDLWESAKGRTVITKVPKVMVEWFLKEYMNADGVVGSELHCVQNGGWFTGVVVRDDGKYEGNSDIGIISSFDDKITVSQYCKETYVVSTTTTTKPDPLPRQRYPKPLIFHDGRLAFFPTPFKTLTMFIWLPLSIPLSILRIFIGSSGLFPYTISYFLASLLGVHFTFTKPHHTPSTTTTTTALYVCTHRTLLDPVFLSFALRRPLTAVTYSLSKFSELISPIKTVSLTRDRTKDQQTMSNLLSEGDLVVCPEGTTCREPYLLRFSSLFAELTDEIVPVAMEAEVSMFYGTTASGFKCLDPIFFFMNPRPGYRVKVLERVGKDMTCGEGGMSSFDVANYVQRVLGDALGFECTGLTRKDKYLMLAGHEGFVGGK